jgi:Rrf2 family protein
MKLISREADYAVRVLCRMSFGDRPSFTARQLEVLVRIPRPFLRKILRILANAGLLVSGRGAHGGFRLNRPLNRIRLIDVMTAFHGPFSINDCTFMKQLCPNRKVCLLRRKIHGIETMVKNELARLTLDSISGTKTNLSLTLKRV